MQQRAGQVFWGCWALTVVIRLWLAGQVPLFVDEAFYWQESRHLAWAYAEVPGMTAWLIGLGTALGGSSVLALRLPFVLLASLVPLLLVGIARRWLPGHQAWWAGVLATIMPLAATLGVLAVPDVPLVVASLVCVLALVRLLGSAVTVGNAALLATGLVLGALSHYRFLGALAFGGLALLALPDGRRLLADRKIRLALCIGALGWLPLLAWNLANDDAGWRFQLLERHPWRFHGEGIGFLVIQPLAVTPLLFVALVSGGWRALPRTGGDVASGYVALYGSLSLVGMFVLGFFTDVERISFHWPLSALLCLLVFVPAVVARWPFWGRAGLWGGAVAGLLVALLYAVMAATPGWRASLAHSKLYPRNFSGWDQVVPAVRQALSHLPDTTTVLAGNFKTGAVLGFALDNPDIAVLPHPLNDRHGRSAQLAQWGLLHGGSRQEHQLLVIRVEDQKFRDLLDYYHWLCVQLGSLPPPQVVSVDQGSQRFLLFALAPSASLQTGQAQCTTPAMAWVDAPVPGQVSGRVLAVRGWAFKDGVGLSGVEVLINGRVMAQAAYGQPYEVRPRWPASTDPGHPDVGFQAQVDLSILAPGSHRLGLRLHGRDGSVEDWTWQSFHYRP